jgi:prophage regulatory protein
MNKTKTPTLPTTGYIRAAILLTFLPFSGSTLWRRVKAGTFPAPVKVSSNITAWNVEKVRAWLDELEAQQ